MEKITSSPYKHSSLFSIFKEFLLEPSSHRLIIQLEQSPGDADGDDAHADIEHHVMPYGRILMIRRPSHLHIHQRIMRDIQRIREIVQQRPDAISSSPICRRRHSR